MKVIYSEPPKKVTWNSKTLCQNLASPSWRLKLTLPKVAVGRWLGSNMNLHKVADSAKECRASRRRTLTSDCLPAASSSATSELHPPSSRNGVIISRKSIIGHPLREGATHFFPGQALWQALVEHIDDITWAWQPRWWDELQRPSEDHEWRQRCADLVAKRATGQLRQSRYNLTRHNVIQ